ncbi:MAG TPA: sigma-70 family RNA polymerase sigma factor [Pseudomonadales bacterium]|nr:sigma-70 family RNA polymerase sigma factor [Pseudomonadales bacterium]
MNDITRILQAIENDHQQSADELLPLVYKELRRLAANRMARENSDHTLQPTALVHEAWLRLAGNERLKWDGRAHFFGAAAEAMRRILVDRARRKSALRHGGGRQRMDLQEADIAAPDDSEQLIAVNDALEKLTAKDKPKADLVKLRYFADMTLEEAAKILGISEPTAKRQWAFAKAWLHREIKSSQ